MMKFEHKVQPIALPLTTRANIKITNFIGKGASSKKLIKLTGKIKTPIRDLISPELLRYK
jgi:hypothetical protein